MTEQTDQTSDATPPSSSGEGETPSFFDAIMESAGPSSSSDEQLQDQDQTAEAGGVPPEDPAQDPEGSPKEDQTAQSAQDDNLKDETDESGADEDLDALTEEDRKHMSERNKRRFDKLLAERKAAREEAAQARPIVEFLQKNDIPMQDVDVIMGLAAQLRHGDFAGFLRTVAPYVQLAQQYTGEALPPDLKKQVDDGLVSPAVARELAQRRAQQVYQSQQVQQQAQSQQEVRTLRAQAIRSAVVDWERQTKQADPDFDAKMGVARRTAQALILERGAPQTPEQAVEYARAAYEEANKVVSTFRPKTATPRTPSSTQQSSPPSRPEPQSMFDVVAQNVGGV